MSGESWIPHSEVLTDNTSSLEDEGTYECQVLGPPILRAPASVWVDIRPARIEMAALAQVKANEETEISCAVYDARPAASVVLKRLGTEYSTTASEETQEPGTASNLITTRVKFKFIPRSSDNLIPFTCSATHNTLSGGQMEVTRTLEVLYPPNAPVVSVQGHNAEDTLRSGQSITLKCESYGGNPLATLEWYKNDEKIDTSYITHDQHKSVNIHTFTASEDDNNAKFKCEAKNPYLTSPHEASVELSVLFPPSEVKITGPSEGSVNSNLTFTCESTKSNPASSLQWVVDNKAVAGSNETSPAEGGGWSTKSEISINIRDYDRYKVVSCYANNMELGERVHTSHRVTIEYPPDELSISGWTQEDVFLEDSVQKVKCTAMTGNPLPKLIWKTGGGNVESQETETVEDEAGNVISVSNEMTLTVDR